MNGIEIVAHERAEQIEKGKTAQHDAELYHSGELVNAALFLLTGASAYYPRTWDKSYQWNFGRKQGVEKLKVAAALLIAEIDRLEFIDNQPF